MVVAGSSVNRGLGSLFDGRRLQLRGTDQHFSENKLRSITLAAAAAILSLSACSTFSGQPRGQVSSWGYSARAQQALVQKFGKSTFKAGDYVWTRQKLGKGSTVVTVLADYGNRYLSKLYNGAFLKEKGLPTPDWYDN